MFESTICSYTSIDPRCYTKGDASLRVVLQNLNLSNMRGSKIYTKIAQRTLLGANDTDWEHTPMEDKVGTLTIKCKSLESFDSNSYRAVGMLIVIGNIVFLMDCCCWIEMIGSWNQLYHCRTSRRLSFHLIEHLLH